MSVDDIHFLARRIFTWRMLLRLLGVTLVGLGMVLHLNMVADVGREIFWVYIPTGFIMSKADEMVTYKSDMFKSLVFSNKTRLIYLNGVCNLTLSYFALILPLVVTCQFVALESTCRPNIIYRQVVVFGFGNIILCGLTCWGLYEAIQIIKKNTRER